MIDPPSSASVRILFGRSCGLGSRSCHVALRNGGRNGRHPAGGPWRFSVEPRGQECLVLGFGDLTPHDIQIHFLDPQCQSITPTFEGLADADDMAQEISLFMEVTPENPIGQTSEQPDQPTLRTAPGILGIERVGECPVLVEVVERASAAGLLTPRGGVELIWRQRLPPEHLMLLFQALEKLFWVKPRLSHVVILPSLLSRVAFTGWSVTSQSVGWRWFPRDGLWICHPIATRIVPVIGIALRGHPAVRGLVQNGPGGTGHCRKSPGMGHKGGGSSW